MITGERGECSDLFDDADGSFYLARLWNFWGGTFGPLLFLIRPPADVVLFFAAIIYLQIPLKKFNFQNETGMEAQDVAC